MSNNQKPPVQRPMGRGPMRFGAKPKDFKTSIKKLFKYIKEFIPLISMGVLFTIISTLIVIYTPTLVKDISTSVSHIEFNKIPGMGPGLLYPDGTLYQSNEVIYAYIKEVGVKLVILYVSSFILGYSQSFITTGINVRLTRKFRNDLSKKINNVPLSYFDRSSVGDILSRITNDVDMVGQSLNQSLSSVVSAGAQLIGVLIAMFVVCWQMAIAAICTVPLSLVFMTIIAKTSQKYFKKAQMSLGALNGVAEESYSGAFIIKSFNAEEIKLKEFEKANEGIYQNAIKSNFLSGLMMPLNHFVGNIGYVAICVVGGYLFVNGKIEIGVLTAFIIYLNLFRSPMQQIGQAMTYLQQMAASAERVFEFLDIEEQEDESHKTAKIENVKGEVVFDNVSFSYNPEKQIIKNFTAHVNPGDKIAIVGPTGAGKTTMVNLLMRFYDINKGKITVDGIDINDMKREDVRSLYSMVLQDTWIFKGTIRENIVYDALNVTDEMLDKACKAANIKAFIDQQPNGYDTILDEKTSLSEGQKQLITIARAMVQNAPMLILDEATSNVDTRTEILIQEAMDKLTKGRTSFVIAHRLSTIKNADLILVLKDGNIIEQGNHDQLMMLNGFYSSLYNSQFSNNE